MGVTLNRRLRDRGVLANHKGPKIRFVTHSQVDEAAVDAAIRAFADIVEDLGRRGCRTSHGNYHGQENFLHTQLL